MIYVYDCLYNVHTYVCTSWCTSILLYAGYTIPDVKGQRIRVKIDNPASESVCHCSYETIQFWLISFSTFLTFDYAVLRLSPAF